jgi:hypothetical protein
MALCFIDWSKIVESIAYGYPIGLGNAAIHKIAKESNLS